MNRETLAVLFGVGALAGLGQLLASEERVTLRLAVGRAVTSGLLGTAAAAVSVWLPDIGVVEIVGVACALASLGTSGVESLIQRITR